MVRAGVRGMDPVRKAKGIRFVVCRLVRQWVKIKYGKTIPDFEVQCGGHWNDDDMVGVLHRVTNAPTITNEGVTCAVRIITTPTEHPSFQGCVNWVKGCARASILPPLVVRTKSGDWVLVFNQGNGKLQGHSIAGGTHHGTYDNYVYVDAATYDNGCPIIDIQLVRYGEPSVFRDHLCCCFFGTPSVTQLYKSGSDVDVGFRQTELDAALLESVDDYDGVLS